MATTTNYSWTTPDDTDLVKDGAAAIRTLGSSIDTSVKALSPGTTAGDIDYYTTSTAKARVGIGTAGQVLVVNSGATAPEWVTPASAAPSSASATVTTQQSTTSATYTDLTTSGPAVTITTGTKCLVILTANINNTTNSGGAAMGFDVSGSTTIAASDSTCLLMSNGSAGGENQRQNSAVYRLNTLTAGSNTFTSKYKRLYGAGNAQFAERNIIVIDLGS
jgi:hypothetical protein